MVIKCADAFVAKFAVFATLTNMHLTESLVNIIKKTDYNDYGISNTISLRKEWIHKSNLHRSHVFPLEFLHWKQVVYLSSHFDLQDQRSSRKVQY
jgi:hypothetical protein